MSHYQEAGRQYDPTTAMPDQARTFQRNNLFAKLKSPHTRATIAAALPSDRLIDYRRVPVFGRDNRDRLATALSDSEKAEGFDNPYGFIFALLTTTNEPKEATNILRLLGYYSSLWQQKHPSHAQTMHNDAADFIIGKGPFHNPKHYDSNSKQLASRAVSVLDQGNRTPLENFDEVGRLFKSQPNLALEAVFHLLLDGGRLNTSQRIILLLHFDRFGLGYDMTREGFTKSVAIGASFWANIDQRYLNINAAGLDDQFSNVNTTRMTDVQARDIDGTTAEIARLREENAQLLLTLEAIQAKSPVDRFFEGLGTSREQLSDRSIPRDKRVKMISLVRRTAAYAFNPERVGELGDEELLKAINAHLDQFEKID